jgi:hypothetical protein
MLAFFFPNNKFHNYFFPYLNKKLSLRHNVPKFAMNIIHVRKRPGKNYDCVFYEGKYLNKCQQNNFDSLTVYTCICIEQY